MPPVHHRIRRFLCRLLQLRFRAIATLSCLLLSLSAAAPSKDAMLPKTQSTTIKTISYHGWPQSYLLSNEVVEAIVVPAVGRVMQFRFVGGEDTFWENRALDGQQPDPSRGEWMNFGGDKCWPSPQSDWPAITGRYWPPPVAFDTAPSAATIDGDTLTLTTSIDAEYGVKVTRRISLAPGSAEMTIRTTYHKLKGEPVKVAIWAITQVRDPQRVFVLLPEQPLFKGGFNQMTGPEPFDLQRHPRMISLRRHPSEKLKIGTDSESLLWLGETAALRIASTREPGTYPNTGSSAEVYTDAPDPYVELETTGALATMKVGDMIEKTNTYTLYKRSTADNVEEARRVFRLPAGSSR